MLSHQFFNAFSKIFFSRFNISLTMMPQIILFLSKTNSTLSFCITDSGTFSDKKINTLSILIKIFKLHFSSTYVITLLSTMYNLCLPLIIYIFFLSIIKLSTMLTSSLNVSVIERMLPVYFPKPISIKDFLILPVLQYNVGSFDIFQVPNSILIGV